MRPSWPPFTPPFTFVMSWALQKKVAPLCPSRSAPRPDGPSTARRLGGLTKVAYATHFRATCIDCAWW